MTELSAHVPETRWEDGEFLLSRGVPDGEPSPSSPLAFNRPAVARNHCALATRL